MSDTVDYGSLATDVVALVEGEPVRLIETLAERVADLCLQRAGVDAVEVCVHKPEAPMTATLGDVTVTIRRTHA